MVRRLKQIAPDEVLLFTDWTLWRLFPPLRAAWARIGQPALVPVTGRNAQRVLFGAINVRTGHRVVLCRQQAGGVDARLFLTKLRRHYGRARTIWLLLDRAPAHTDAKTMQWAADLRMKLVWLPKQASELNAMDQIWKELKRLVAANRQANHIESLAQQAEDWLLSLTPHEARCKARLLSPNFWLKNLLQNFWPPT
jgi:transposase